MQTTNGFEGDLNPYSVPATEAYAEPLPTQSLPQPCELVSRGNRFAGALIDNLLLLVTAVPPAIVIMIFALSDMDEDSLQFDLITSAIVFPCMLVMFLILNGYLLKTRGQTIGKLLLNSQIVDDLGRVPPLRQSFGKRYMVIWLLAMLPFVGRLIGLVDAVMIFNQDRKCLHDQIAATRVVKYDPLRCEFSSRQ